MTKRAEFTQKTKLEAMARYLRCPGVPEKHITCGKAFGKLANIEFDHIKRDEIDGDNSPENCRPLCAACHRVKTSGVGATSAGSDTHMAAKGKRLRADPPGGTEWRAKIVAKILGQDTDGQERTTRRKAVIKSAGFDKTRSRKMNGKVVPR